jgi:HD-like signal output (HDOD) protein/signal transduction histidine kinase
MSMDATAVEHVEQVSGRQVEAILAGITRLPTLPAVAAQLLSMGADEDVRLDEVIELIEADPALSARMLSLCRSADAGLGDRITTVRRAVIMLGLEAVRTAVLSVLIFDQLRVDVDSESEEEPAFDLEGFWTRAIAVACTSEWIAKNTSTIGVSGEEAYLAGLLHGLGKLALYNVLPKSWEKALAMAESHHLTLSGAERATIGLDHHTAGKRLSEHWGLPESIRDVVWLHGQPRAALPEHCNAELVLVTTLSCLWCDSQHLGWSGDGVSGIDIQEIASDLGVDLETLDSVSGEIVERVSERARILGVGEFSAPELLFSSLTRANTKLASINQELRGKQQIADRSHSLLAAVDVFYDAIGDGVEAERIVEGMVRSGGKLTGINHGMVIMQNSPGAPWMKYQVVDGKLVDKNNPGQVVVGPSISDSGEIRPGHIAGLSGDQVLDLANLDWFRLMIQSVREIGVASLIGVGDCGELGESSDSVSCLIVLVKASSEAAPELSAKGFRVVQRAWARALENATQAHDAKVLAEELASANRELAAMQRQRTKNESLLRLGQMAAGAAHEMNNPLSVINGRSQQLFERLGTQRDRDAAQAIAQAADSLSSMITSMHLLAEPPEPTIASTDPVLVVRQAIEQAKSKCHRGGIRAKVKLQISGILEPIDVDRELMASAISEPIINAVLSNPSGVVNVSIEPAGGDGRVMVRIVDTGPGLSQRALNHAFDPFFSELKAGRRPGLGLSRSRSVIELHGGAIDIANTAGKVSGAQVQIVLRGKHKGRKTAA